MSSRTRSKRRRSGRGSVHKANGVLHPRVQKVGPEHFGIVCVDVGKAKSDWMLCDFYGKVLVEPTEVLHTRCGFDLAIVQLREAIEKNHVRDQVVAIERTGNYHLPVKRAFAAASFETRIVHPFATKQFRQPADPGNKTDDNDRLSVARFVNIWKLCYQDTPRCSTKFGKAPSRFMWPANSPRPNPFAKQV